MISRDASYQALADRIASVLTGWQVVRTYYDWDDPRIVQPACIVVSNAQQPLQEPQRGTIWKLSASVILYLKNTDPTVITDTLINQALDSIDGALRIQVGEHGDQHTTLGGLVLHAWIDAVVETFQGIPGDQTVVAMNVAMLAA